MDLLSTTVSSHVDPYDGMMIDSYRYKKSENVKKAIELMNGFELAGRTVSL
jgi:hypothetical protein